MYKKELMVLVNLEQDDPILNLVNNPEFMLKFNLVTLCKNHNFFGKIDSYMKEFSRILLSLED